MTAQPTLRTERLVLRPFELDDVPDVTRLAGDAEVASTTLNIPHPYAPEMAESWIRAHATWWGAGELANFAVTLRESGEVVGAIGLVLNTRHENAELGYWIGRPYWGRGYATEAARAVVEFGLDGLGLHRVHAHHFTRNPASGRVLLKVGMRYEGRLREHVRKGEAFEDVDTYGILRSDRADAAPQG